MRQPWPERPFATPADHAACREMIRHGSRSFFAASHLLPGRVRAPAYALYAFCRSADDAVDQGSDVDAALDVLNERLARAYCGDPLPTPVDRAFADLVALYAIPRALPEALLEGLAWDAGRRRYDDLSALCAYAARVAGTVGLMMTLLMGVREPGVLARACDLGIAMQLTNIARDVGEDAGLGRIYLPLQWLRAAGIDPDDWLARPSSDERLGAVVQKLLCAADALYDRAIPGIARLPSGCRPGILAAHVLYAEIGRQVERIGCDSVTLRAVVPGRRKALLLGKAFAAAPFLDAGPDAPAPTLLEAARFLVDAVAASAPPASSPGVTPPWWDVAGRAVLVIELFERIERRRRAGPTAPASGVAPTAEPAFAGIAHNH
ncbi:MAG: phytoene/squalene synthase family protein [Xanthobacteraceae bacterium]